VGLALCSACLLGRTPNLPEGRAMGEPVNLATGILQGAILAWPPSDSAAARQFSNPFLGPQVSGY